MSAVHVQLDRPHACFTNLDNITGRVILNLLGDETVTAIVVKLECESRTRLAAPPVPGYSGRADQLDKTQTKLEVHKLLYKVETVFPTRAILQAAPGNSSFTLPTGQHVYHFQFKVPFNNSCVNTNSMMTNLNVTGMRMEMARDTERHVKKPLPPTLSGFPGEAEIKYYVKATVQRAAFYKENFRATTFFKFLPIEPPRDPPNRRESYARRRHQFSPHVDVPQKSGPFRKASVPTSSKEEAPKISVDGRLPDPAIITCNEPLPLRVIARKLNETSEILFLTLLQVELIGYTTIRAHDLTRKESSSWVVVSLANLKIPLGNSETPADRDMEVDQKLWTNIPLPNTVSPSFETCNLSRHYTLQIRIGLVYGRPGNMKPELTVQTLDMPVTVYSGIPPPQALLAEMARRPTSLHPNARRQSYANAKPPSFSIPSSQSPSPGRVPNVDLPRPSSWHHAATPNDNAQEEPPPSYEDAMAEDLAPVDGPRRNYEQPEVRPVMGDSKRSGLFGSR